MKCCYCSDGMSDGKVHKDLGYNGIKDDLANVLCPKCLKKALSVKGYKSVSKLSRAPKPKVNKWYMFISDFSEPELAKVLDYTHSFFYFA